MCVFKTRSNLSMHNIYDVVGRLSYRRRVATEHIGCCLCVADAACLCNLCIESCRTRIRHARDSASTLVAVAAFHLTSKRVYVKETDLITGYLHASCTYQPIMMLYFIYCDD